MAQTARSFDPAPLETPLPAVADVVALGESPAIEAPSPARALHQQLVESFAPAQPSSPPRRDRLPVRTRAFAITGAILAPWAIMALGYALLG